MYKLFFHKSTIVIYDQSDKDFKHKYGHAYEQVGVVKDDANIAVIVERMKKQYGATEVVYDCHIKKKWGWRYFTEEQKETYRKMWSAKRRGRKLSAHQKERISEGKTGKRGNHTGKTHSASTKNVMSLRALGHKRNVGKKWCYDLLTGAEKRCTELPKGFVWGRNPEHELGRYLPPRAKKT